jgi:hypothetical protein
MKTSIGKFLYCCYNIINNYIGVGVGLQVVNAGAKQKQGKL